ncbi:NAD(P)-dependent oxidoreductase, partial [Alistipes ihumii]
EMLPQCDIVTCHVPLSVNGDYPTKAMADASFFASMKPGAVFVNTSRGGIVVDEDLIEARRSGRLSHAVIDTWNDEPHISRDLLGLASLATPHIAGYTVQGKAAGTAAAVRAVSRHYSMPLDDWYPPQVMPGKPDPSIGWERMSSAMPRYFDIEAETSRLRAHPELFETMRNNYRYRNEFF